MEPNKDALQLKIEEARKQLSPETRQAIDSVDWMATILKIKENKGYNLEQLSDLETETELLLCGLTDPKNYPTELGSRMQITKEQVNDIVNEMNESVFKKIREKLMEITAEKEEKDLNNNKERETLNKAGIEITTPNPLLTKEGAKGEVGEKRSEMISDIENPELIQKTNISPDKGRQEGFNPLPSQKLSGSFTMPTKQTEYSIDNMSKPNNPTPPSAPTPQTAPYKVDPYRELPE